MPADAVGTRFPGRVLRVAAMTRLLVSGHSNIKLGRDVRKGKFRGYWIYTLSLQERLTCPASCQHWRSCYGNAMPFGKRVDHDDPDFLPRLEQEILGLCRTKKGVLIRLHALGDFYSVAYVRFWRSMLVKHHNLAIFGYTARPAGTAIGREILAMNSDRCMIRFSDAAQPDMATVSIRDASERPANAFVCPEQTGGTACCATCGACWSTKKTVAFLEH